MAYSNVTPPPLPEYDTETYGFYVLVFNYELGAEDWYQVHLIYGSWRFQYDEGVGVTNIGSTFTKTYGDGSWSVETQNEMGTLALNPGINGSVYQRIYTDANIFNGDEIWLAENTVTPLEEREKFPIKEFINGMIMALCSRGRIPQPEPVAYLYGHVAKEGETPTHAINGVGYVGFIGPKLPERDMSVFPNVVVVGYNLLSDNTPTDFLVYASAEPAYLDEGETIAGGYRTVIEVKKPWMSLNGYSEDIQWCGYVGDNWVKTYGAWTSDRGLSTTSRRLMLDGKVEARIVWANHNVLNEDGSVFFAACPDPTPAYINTMKYLYNGAAAPPLPTETGNGGFAWNKEKYPYAVLNGFEYSSGVYLVVFSVKPTAYTSEDSFSFPTEALYMHYSQVFPGCWYSTGLERKLSAGVNNAAYLGIPHWANFDIVDENGNVVLAASEPVPVYE